MRIAYVSADPGVPVFGRKGCSIHVQEVIRGFLRAGADVTLFSTRPGGDPPRDLAAVPVHRLAGAGGAASAAREEAALAASADHWADVQRQGPFDLVYERHALWSFAPMEGARAAGWPGLLEVNAPLLEEQARYRRLHDERGAAESVRRSLRAAAAIVAVSDGVADRIRGETTAPVHVIPNGVDVQRFAPGRRAGPSGELTIGFVGTLKPWHGVEVLVDAFVRAAPSLPPARLLIVGDGPERERLEEAVAAGKPTGSVVFTGAVDPSEVPRHIASMDIAVAPYPALDGFYFSPLKVFEYMAAGRAVVASAIGQLEDVVSHGRTGLLVAPGDAAALADALVRLGGDEPLRAQLGRRARDEVVRHHTWDAVVRRILELGRAPGAATVRRGA